MGWDSNLARYGLFPFIAYASLCLARLIVQVVRDGRVGVKWLEVLNGWPGLIVAGEMSVFTATATYTSLPKSSSSTAMSSLMLAFGLFFVLCGTAVAAGWIVDPGPLELRTRFVMQSYVIPHVVALMCFYVQAIWVVFVLRAHAGSVCALMV